MNELIAAIQQVWADDATLSEVAAPFDMLAKDKATHPYATYSIFSAEDRYHFGGTVVAQPVVSFAVFDISREDLGTYVAALDDAFSLVKLEVETWAHMSTRCIRREFSALSKPAPTGDTIYRGVIDFRFELHRDLPS